MDDNKKFWDRFSGIYEKVQTRDRASKRFFQILNEKTVSYLNKDMDVLELAMGPAMITADIATACRHLTATDFSEKMVAQATKKNLPDNVTVEQADATELRYRDKFFDAVVIANALHIMPNPEKALSEITRVMKDDGILIAPTYTRDKTASKFKERLMEAAGFKTYFPWNHESYIRYLSEHGFVVIYNEVIPSDFPESFVVCQKQLTNEIG